MRKTTKGGDEPTTLKYRWKPEKSIENRLQLIALSIKTMKPKKKKKRFYFCYYFYVVYTSDFVLKSACKEQGGKNEPATK